MRDENTTAQKTVWGLVILLAILHQDFWFWDNHFLVLGFLPVGLFYHALFSIAAGLLWAAAVKWAWPTHVEAWADELENEASGGQGGGDR